MHEFLKKDDQISIHSFYNMPIKVIRKVREISGSLYIYIPKYWADSVGLAKDKSIRIELTDDHSCKIETEGVRE